LKGEEEFSSYWASCCTAASLSPAFLFRHVKDAEPLVFITAREQSFRG
ncbi:uncharacterized, partial [Tachysurus ichikawai]